MKTMITIRWLVETIALQLISLSFAVLFLIWFAKAGW